MRCSIRPAKNSTRCSIEFGLHELAVEDARHGHQRPKIEEYGDSLFVVLHLLEPAADGSTDLDVGEVNVFVGPNYVLSVRNRSKLGFLGVRERCEREPELLRMGSGFVLYALMDAVVDRYFPIIDALEVELEAIEQQIFTKGAAKGQHQAALRTEAAGDGAQARGRAAARRRRASSTAGACRRSAWACRNTFATSPTT